MKHPITPLPSTTCFSHRPLYHSHKVQRGGTFLGLILGLVLGLGVALAVAVYITKVPVPFLNKGQSRSGEQDAAEAKKNKDWDPNGMIQGKNPVRSTSGPVASGSELPPPQEPAKEVVKTATDTKTGAKAEGKADVKIDAKASGRADAQPEAKKPPVSADPLGDLAQAKSASAFSVDPFTYMVQTGAFRTSEDAQAQRAKLALLGVDVKVTEREQSGRTVFRVRTGPFERKDDAEKAKEKLEASGFETALVRTQR